MRTKELNTIKQLIDTEVFTAIDMIKESNNDGNCQEVSFWNNKLTDLLLAKEAISSIIADDSYGVSPEDHMSVMISQTKMVQQLLHHCAITPEADIYITVRHHDGNTATAKLYDHAALVQSLYDSLDYFLSEL